VRRSLSAWLTAAAFAITFPPGAAAEENRARVIKGENTPIYAAPDQKAKPLALLERGTPVADLGDLADGWSEVVVVTKEFDDPLAFRRVWLRSSALSRDLSIRKCGEFEIPSSTVSVARSSLRCEKDHLDTEITDCTVDITVNLRLSCIPRHPEGHSISCYPRTELTYAPNDGDASRGREAETMSGYGWALTAGRELNETATVQITGIVTKRLMERVVKVKLKSVHCD
jgi:hypothetical protein